MQQYADEELQNVFVAYSWVIYLIWQLKFLLYLTAARLPSVKNVYSGKVHMDIATVYIF